MCQDINGGDKTGTKLVNAADGKGADWEKLWSQYANRTPDTFSKPENQEEFLQ